MYGNQFHHLLAPGLAIALAAGNGLGRDFYVSPNGDDTGPGTITKPWRSVARVSAADFAPGDRVLFLGGATFRGTIRLDANDAGTAARPVVLTSYGTGRATIHGGSGAGFLALDCGGIELRNLAFVGSGPATNTAAGVGFLMNLSRDVKLDHIRVDRVEISGFGSVGLFFGSDGRAYSGYRDVRVTWTLVHGNRRDGMFTWGKWTVAPGARYSHEGFYVGHCKFYDNTGIPRKNTGHGIFLKDVDGGVIEYCEAYNNGAAGGSTNGGPVGIWALQSNNVVIQFNESHHNHSAGGTDGAGFDLDGGTSNSVLQYNYSHDNDGPGYLLVAGFWARPTFNNRLRFNISENDARAHNAAIFMWAQGRSVKDTVVHGNTVFVGVGATSPAFEQAATSVQKVGVYDNLFVTTGGRDLVRVASARGLTFRGNDYWPSGGTFRIRWGSATYGSLSAWRTATGQERIGSTAVGFQVDPRLANAGGGATIGDPADLANLAAYRLLPDSPLVDRGLDLKASFGVDPGARDYYGAKLPRGSGFDVGAHERVPGRNRPPLVLVSPGWGPIPKTATYVVTIDDPDGLADLASLDIDVALGGSWFSLWPGMAGLFQYRLDSRLRVQAVLPGLGLFTSLLGPWPFRARLRDRSGLVDQKLALYSTR